MQIRWVFELKGKKKKSWRPQCEPCKILHICTCKMYTNAPVNSLEVNRWFLGVQVSPAQPTGGRRRRTVDDDPDERRQRFLERNRAAASRCRQKRKLWVNSLEKKAEELTSMNVSLSVSVLHVALSNQVHAAKLSVFRTKCWHR